MKTLETDVEINPDGSIKLLSPLPGWLTPGRQHLLLVVDEPLSNLPAPPEEETLLDTLRRLRELGTFQEIDDPVVWQRKVRRDRPLPGRD